jgi:hypothetical protein
MDRDTPMTQQRVTQTKMALLIRHGIILVLAGLLIFYHNYTLFDLYLGARTSTHTTYEYVQSILRVAITLSLLFVVFGSRRALWGMWISIVGLVATHYWAHFGNLPVDFTQGRHPLSYLKGLIIPTIITMAFHSSIFPAELKTKDNNHSI